MYILIIFNYQAIKTYIETLPKSVGVGKKMDV